MLIRSVSLCNGVVGGFNGIRGGSANIIIKVRKGAGVQEVSKKLLSVSDFTKGHVVLLSMIPFYLIYLGTIETVLSLSNIPAFLHQDNIRQLTPVFYGMIAASLLLSLIGSIMQYFRWPGERLFLLCVLTMTVVFQAYSGYQIGSLSIATGIVLMSAAILGLIFVGVRVILFQFTLSITLVFGSSLASSLGYIVYSPVFVGGPTGGEHPELLWVLAMICFSIPFIILFLVFCFVLINLWQQHDEEILSLASTDSLTQLYNRRFLMDSFKRELTICERRESDADAVSCIILDLDHFKQVNDLHGHQMGDDVLVKVAQVIVQSLRDYDIAGRYGGEEFMLILPNTAIDIAQLVAERCREKVASLEWPINTAETLTVTASFGVATCAVGQKVSINNMIKAADDAMYQAKDNGRNCVVLAEQVVI